MAKRTTTTAQTQKSKLLAQVGASPAVAGGMESLGSASSIDRMLTRFGWLGDSDEVLARVGISRVQLRSLETDEEIASNLETRCFAVTNTPWRFEHPQARAARFFTDAFAPHMDALLTNLWSAVPYGYSVTELVYTEPNDPTNATPGRYGIGQVIDVPFEWVQMLPAGIMVWRDNATECDPRKFFACVQSGSLRKPSGEALLSKLYWPWFFRTHGWKMWAKHMERVAIPFLYGKTDSDRSSAIAALSNAVQDAVFVSGKNDELTALNMGTGGNTLFSDFETAVTRRIKMAILGQTLTSGTDGGSGNRALGQVHNEVRLEKKQADGKLIAQSVQRMADALAALNGIPAPTFIMEDGSGLEIERANRDKILVDAGMVKFTPDYIKDKYDLLETDFTVPEDAPAPVSEQNQPLDPANSAQAAMNTVAPFQFVDGRHDHKPRFTAGQQAIEDQVDKTLANFISPITHKAIASAIAGATSADDLIERLGVAMQDSTDAQFRQTLERALFAADLMGYGQSQGSHKAQQPAQPVQAAAHTINLSAPITIQMPEQAAPVVHMAAPAPANVQVDVHPTVSAELIMPKDAINVQPTAVTVNNMHPARAVQTVERDAQTDEITKTITTYEAQ
jgi:phage gp29-like protein